MKKGTIIFLIIIFVIAIALWQIESSKSKIHICSINYEKTCTADADCSLNGGNFSGVCNTVSLKCEHFTSSSVNRTECLNKSGKYK